MRQNQSLTRGSPWAVNHSLVSAGERTESAVPRKRPLSPYLLTRSRLSSSLVRLHCPPPETSNLRPHWSVFSRMRIDIREDRSFARIAQNNPAGPPPITTRSGIGRGYLALRASETSFAKIGNIMSLRSIMTSGCHCTPQVQGPPSTASTASIPPSSARAATSSPSPTSLSC